MKSVLTVPMSLTKRSIYLAIDGEIHEIKSQCELSTVCKVYDTQKVERLCAVKALLTWGYAKTDNTVLHTASLHDKKTPLLNNGIFCCLRLDSCAVYSR